MEKYALIEVGTTHIRLTLANAHGESFHIHKVLNEPIHINQHIEADGLIKAAKCYECVSIVKRYKKICDANNVTNISGVAAHSIMAAKNFKSFVDELSGAIGIEFKLMSPEQETNAIYTAVVNTLDVAKGLLVNISSHSTRIIHYSRRMILDSVTIPFGSVSLFETTKSMPIIATDLFMKELRAHAAFLSNLDPETHVIGVSDVFTSFGRIARRMKKYPLDIDHNYTTDTETFYQVFDFVKTLDM